MQTEPGVSVKVGWEDFAQVAIGVKVKIWQATLLDDTRTEKLHGHSEDLGHFTVLRLLIRKESGKVFKKKLLEMSCRMSRKQHQLQNNEHCNDLRSQRCMPEGT